MPLSQIKGGVTATIPEVEATTRALRATLRPDDYGSLGIYSVGGNSGLMAAGLAQNVPIFAFQWTSNAAICALRRVRLTAAGDATAFAVGYSAFVFTTALSYRVAATGGTALTPAGNMNKLRTSMGTSLVGDIRIATTGALGAGTWQLAVGLANDGFAKLGFVGAATAAKQMVGPQSGDVYGSKAYTLFAAKPGEYPMVFAANEGFIIRSPTSLAFPATGTWRFAVTCVWEELAAYPNQR